MSEDVTLVDEVASLLYAKFRPHNPNSHVYWNDVAREVIRQMEWARDQAHAEWVAGYGYQEGASREHRAALPITLAPPEWKP